MPLRRLDVLVVMPHAVHGGQEEWLLQMLQATARLRPRVLLLQDGPLRRTLEAAGLPVEVVPVGTRPRELPGPVLRVAALLHRQRPDVVLANGVKAQFVAGPAAWLAGIPLVFARHDHAFENLVRRLAAFADAVVGTSEEVLAAVGRSDAQVLPPPLSRPALDRTAARERLAALGIETDADLVLGMLTRVVSAKGIEDGLRALTLPGGVAWRLVVLGGDDPSEPGERARLRALAGELGVADRVHLPGHVPGGGELVAGFDALAVLTHRGTARAGGEGFGMAALEAMSAGVPVVAVGGGAVERRLAGQAGLVVPDHDPAAVAAALGGLTRAGRRAELGQAGRRLAQQHASAAETAQLLAGVLSQTARRPGAGLDPETPVSVVVPLYNEESEVDALVASLAGQLRPADELLAVDDCSTDATVDRLRSLQASVPALTVVTNERNGGASAARNAGVRRARHDLIVCTDAGNDLPDGWLDGMRAALSEVPAPDLVTGCFRVGGTTRWQRAMAVALYPDVADVRQPGPLYRLTSPVIGRSFSASRPAGRSLAFHRDAWRRVGGFREDLRTAEDTAFGLAVAATGRCVLQADQPVVWRQHATLLGTARMFAAYGRGDGLQGERVVVLRNFARAVAASTTPVLLARGSAPVRAAVLALGAGYVAAPMWKLRTDATPLRTALLVPVALATKDLAKAYGCGRGLLLRQRRRRSS